jgi:hypothetical protein
MTVSRETYSIAAGAALIVALLALGIALMAYYGVR